MRAIDTITDQREHAEKLERWALICANAGEHDEAERLRREASQADTQEEGSEAA